MTLKGDFNIKEKITQETLTGTKTGTVIGWNRNNNTLRVATGDVFEDCLLYTSDAADE